MKKVLLVFAVIISLGLVACSNGNIGNNANNKQDINKEKTTKIVNGVEVTLTDKAKKIENYEYVDEFQNLFNKLYKKYGEKVHHPDRDSIEYYKASKAQHKELVESLSKFRTNDENVNKYHDQLIDIFSNRVKLNGDMIKLIEEKNKLKEKDNITDDDQKNIDKFSNQIEVLKKMIENSGVKNTKCIERLEEVLGVTFEFNYDLTQDIEYDDNNTNVDIADTDNNTSKEGSPGLTFGKARELAEEYVQNNLKGYELYSGISGEQGYYYEVYPVDPSIEQGDGGVIVYWDGTVGEGSDFY
ncbi:hypothetical protein [Metaclostridioides mangenotii]|uniref:hypothetical protein n=1 Tax=Metaclostridioides mangenotii TaxID=1540 RepID=UPI00046639DD|nr:hypothetical protein [Clostridioides mangenotii]